MNWKKEAENDLRKYEALRSSVERIPERIRSIQDRMEAIKGSVTDSTPVKGGASTYEDNLLNCIVEKERLKMLYSADMRLLKAIEKGLASLSEKELEILKVFYISRTYDAAGELGDRYHIEKSQVYRLKDNALLKFTSVMYGISEY